MKYLSCVILSLFISIPAFTQKEFQVIDSEDGEGIPFVQYSYQSIKKVSDINGIINLENNVKWVSLKSYGYKDTTISLSSIINGSKLIMQSEDKVLGAVTINPGVNPALRIVNNAIANRKKNDPNSEIAYRAETYSKFIFSMDSLFDTKQLTERDSLYQRLEQNRKNSDNKSNNSNAKISVKADTTENIKNDTLGNEGEEKFKDLLNRSHLMILESASTKEFMPPYRLKETINAYKVSGFNIPELANFANQIQAFSFYDNVFELLGSSYINPIAFGATKKYSYLIQDTILNSRGDSTFVIRFFPRINKKFDALYGQIYINSTSWAIEKVITQPAVDKYKMFYVRIVQDYQYVDNKKWFPKDLVLELTSPSIEFEGRTLSGKGYTHINSVTLNPDLKKRDFNNILVETQEGAGNTKEDSWSNKRNIKLTDKERNTYNTIDSIAKENNFDNTARAFGVLMNGKFPMGYLNLDLSKIVNFNLYEGYRLGAGIETSNKLSKFFQLGGYFAYGTYDKAWKYGGFLNFDIQKKNDVSIKLTYSEDVIDRGMMNFEPRQNSFDLNTYYNGFYIRNKDNQRLSQLSINGKPWTNLNIRLSGNYRRIEFTENYRYILNDNSLQKGTDLFDITAEFTWTPLAKWSLIEGKYFKLEDKFPTLRLQLAKSAPILQSEYDYWRFRLDLSQHLKIYRFGQIDWLITGSKTIGTTPLLLQNAPFGTRGKFNLSIVNTFETMLPNTFYSSQYTAAFFRWTTESWMTKLKFFSPSLSIHQAFGIGNKVTDDFRQSNNLTFHSMEKGYWESGIIINKIIKISYFRFGFGVFYHYGAYSAPLFKDNLTYKLSLLFELK